MHWEMKNVSKKYDRPILEKIDLRLEGHRTIGIIGRSGCGKSTLLRLLSGIEPPDSGTIYMNDFPVDREHLQEYQKTISMVFQQHNLFPHLSLKQNITLILEKIRGISREAAEQRACGLLTRLHLENEGNKLPRQVSGGQAQRASIARALSTHPRLIFMDEPTAALDPQLTREVLDAVLELKDSGTCFIFVTHEIEFVRQFAEYILFLEEGIIKEQGRPEILENPETESLRAFLQKETPYED